MACLPYSSEDLPPQLLDLLGPRLSLTSKSLEQMPLLKAKEMKDSANQLFRLSDMDSKFKACCLYLRIASAVLTPEDAQLTRIAYCNTAQAYFDTGKSFSRLVLIISHLFLHSAISLEPQNPTYDDRLLTAKAFARAAKAMCASNQYDEALEMLEHITECNVYFPQAEEVREKILDMKGRWSRPVPGPDELLWSYRAVLTSKRYYDLQLPLPHNFAEVEKQDAIKLLQGIYEITEQWFKETGDFICRVCSAPSLSGIFLHAEVIRPPPARAIVVTVMSCCSDGCRVKAEEIDVGWGTAL
ncbi:hypothetical protein DL96DRAFT_1739520 [Flagelloscypha sp. PMI_526]|nr:hypothetical protein DL96DRAFT_1739520 [Flagelloscypha sp. PMI_526]